MQIHNGIDIFYQPYGPPMYKTPDERIARSRQLQNFYRPALFCILRNIKNIINLLEITFNVPSVDSNFQIDQATQNFLIFH